MNKICLHKPKMTQTQMSADKSSIHLSCYLNI
jgi:hypothetical protein